MVERDGNAGDDEECDDEPVDRVRPGDDLGEGEEPEEPEGSEEDPPAPPDHSLRRFSSQVGDGPGDVGHAGC
jgi:hypothetical protein